MIRDLSPLGAAPALTELHLAGCGATDFSFVSTANLVSLTVRSEKVDSLAPLASETTRAAAASETPGTALTSRTASGNSGKNASVLGAAFPATSGTPWGYPEATRRRYQRPSHSRGIRANDIPAKLKELTLQQ